MRAVFAVIFLLFVLLFTSIFQSDTTYAASCPPGGACFPRSACVADGGTPVPNSTCSGGYCCVWATNTPTRTPTPKPKCSSLGGTCWPGPQNLCYADGGTVRSATGCSGSAPICCVFPPTATPTRTPTPRPPCSSLGGVCLPSQGNLCVVDGGTPKPATGCSGTTPVCCVFPPTSTPTPTPTPRPSCSSLFGQCWSGPRNLCLAEGGDDKNATGCGGSAPICCVYNDLKTRCELGAGGVYSTPNLLDVYSGGTSYNWEPIPNFPSQGAYKCYKEKPGCSSNNSSNNGAGCSCAGGIEGIGSNPNGGALWALGCKSGGCKVTQGSNVLINGSFYLSTSNGIYYENQFYVPFVTNITANPPYNSGPYSARLYSYNSGNNTYTYKKTINNVQSFTGACIGLPAAPIPPVGNPTYNISGRVFIDIDSDGIKDSNENQGVPNVTVIQSESSKIDTTDGSGNYVLTGFAGNWMYDVSVSGTLAGYVVTTNPIAVDINNANVSNINFGIAPIYSISGSVFEDTDGDRIKDAGEVNYTKGVINITSTGGAITAPSGAGTYTITNLLRGTYTVSLTPLTGYSRTPPGFSVTVGSPCSIVNPNPGASCSGNNVINLNFAIRTSGAWIQTYGFDVGIYDGYTNIVPAGSAYPPYSAVASD